MKPKIRYAVIGISVLVLIALIALLARGKDKLLQYIPDDAAMVLRIDPTKMLADVNLKKLTGSDPYRAMESNAYGETSLLTKLVAKAGRHPEKTGIKWNKPVYMFMRSEKGKVYNCILFHVQNAKTLKEWVESELPRNASVKTDGELNLVSRPYGQSWGWNNEALILLDVSSRHGSDLLEDHLNKMYDDYIGNKSEFNQAMQRDAGISIYANIPAMNRAVEKVRLDKMFQNYLQNYMAIWLDFNKGEIQFSMRMMGEKNASYQEVSNTTPAPESIVGTSDGKSPLMHVAMNMKWRELFTMMQDAEGKSRRDNDLDGLLAVLSELQGGTCLQLAKSKLDANTTGDEMQDELEDEDDYYSDYGYRNSPMPVGMTIRLQLKNQPKTLDSLIGDGRLIRNLSNIGSFTTTSVQRPPGMLRLLYDQEEKGPLKYWDDKRLPTGFFKKPFQFFVDLDPQSNPFLAESNPYLRESVRKKFAMHLSPFSHFYLWSDAKGGDCKLVFKDKNTSSMEILLNMILDMNSIDADI